MKRTSRSVEVKEVTLTEEELIKLMAKAASRVARIVEDPTVLAAGAIISLELVSYIFGEKED
jgi:hypothetical protein